MTESQVPAPIENIPRGTLLALVIVPVGIVVWLLIWSLGFIASIVAFGIAIGAMMLYRLGAGRMGRTGAIRVAIITIVTLLLALVAGYAWDVAVAFAQVNGGSPLDAFGFPRFWSVTFEYMFTDGLLSTLLALGFGALGCFSVLRSGFAEAKQADSALANPLAGPGAAGTPAGDPQTGGAVPSATGSDVAQPEVAAGDGTEDPRPSA